MKTKILSLVLLTAILAIGMVSATDCLTLTEVSVPLSVQDDVGSFDVQVNIAHDGGACTANRTGITWSFDSNIEGLTWIEPTLTDLAFEDTQNITINFNLPEGKSGDININIETLSDQDDEETNPLILTSVPITETTTNIPSDIEACELTGDFSGNLEVQIKKVDVVKGFGDDEEWYPFDEVEVEIRIKNNDRDEKIEDIVVEWGLYDSVNDYWYIDDEENDFNLKSRDDKTIVITFKLDDDIEDLENYDKFYVWANAEINDQLICAWNEEDIDMQIEDDFVILDNIKIVESAQCGMDLQIVADVWNIGEDDQEDVYVRIYEPDLGIDKKVTIGDIDGFDDEKLDITIQIPEDAEEGTYFLRFTVYDEDDDIYENGNDDRAIFSVPLKVEGNCKVAPKATITATLDSEAKAGKELVIKTTIVNTGDKEATYTLHASDYESWASFKSINPAVVVLASGESVEVIYKLNVNKDALGLQTFNIELKTGESEKETLKQPVSVTVEESTGFSFPGFTGASIGLGDNWYLWGIGLLNVILIIIIIVVAIRVAKS